MSNCGRISSECRCGIVGRTVNDTGADVSSSVMEAESTGETSNGCCDVTEGIAGIVEADVTSSTRCCGIEEAASDVGASVTSSSNVV